MENQKKIVVIGGGTGNFSVLSGLKKYPIDLSAIVSMSDSGGHSGKLRDELGVLPPGDVRACLVALADDDNAEIVRDLFNYRFENGSQRGASVGNLLLTALNDILGGFDAAVKAAHKLLGLRGKVIPVSLEKAHLLAELKDGTILFGESAIDVPEKKGRAPITRVWLQPKVKTNSEALAVIREADLVIFGPGDLYTSILPNLCTEGIADALKKTRALFLANVNVMTKQGETDGYDAEDFVRVLESQLPRSLDYVVYNTKKMPPSLLAKYKKEGSFPVAVKKPQKHWIGADILSARGGLARHDSQKVARVIMSILGL